MPSPKVRSDYEQLAAIAQQFQQQSERSNQTLQALRQNMNTLQSGDWIGKGATAFYQEMDSAIVPSMQRLVAALNRASISTRQIAQLMKQAEMEAAGVLRYDGNTNGANSGSGTGASDGGVQGDSGSGGGAGGGNGSSAGGSGGKLGDVKVRVKVEQGSSKREIGVDLAAGAVAKGEALDGVAKGELLGGSAGFKFGQDKDGKFMAGAAAEVYAARGKLEGTMVGDKDLGWTGGVEAKALSAKGFAGIKDGSIGAEVGVNLISAKAETGANIAGYNVGVSGEIGLKLELGLSIGKRTNVKLGPISFGFSFGDAK